MHSPLKFSSLVLAALMSWAAVAGALALSTSGDASGVRTVADAFPTAEAGFAPRPAPAAN